MDAVKPKEIIARGGVVGYDTDGNRVAVFPRRDGTKAWAVETWTDNWAHTTPVDRETFPSKSEACAAASARTVRPW